MNQQLRLLEPVEEAEDSWRLDKETRRIGLAGVRSARIALNKAHPNVVATLYAHHANPDIERRHQESVARLAAVRPLPAASEPLALPLGQEFERRAS